MQLGEPGLLEPFAWSPVLIVDDDQASALLALKLLLRAGLRTVDTLNDARQVLEWVESHDPDLVLLDLHMPYLDGFGVLKVLRDRWSTTELPVVVLTADDTLDASNRALELGANDFLLKPLQPTALTHRVRTLLEMRAAHRSLERRQRWLEEAERFSRELFSGDIEAPLATMATRALRLADADHVLTVECGLDDGPEACLEAPEVRIETAAGSDRPLVVELGQHLRDQVASKATPVLVDDAAEDPDITVTGDPEDVGPMMLLPVPGADSTRGLVGLLRRRGREPYAPRDLETAHQFVTRAALAIELLDRRTDRKRYLDFFEILVSQISEYAIVRLDVDGNVASWSTGAERVEGYAADEALGRPLSTFFPEDEVRAGLPELLLEEARRTGRAHHHGWRLRGDGTRFWGEGTITALHDEHGGLIGFAKVTRDLTESRSLELARESFFASLSHDLRAPLNSIQGFVEMIPMVEEGRRGEFIDRVQSNVERLTVLIDNLLDHARLRAGAMALAIEAVDAVGAVRSCVSDLAPLLRTHEVVVEDGNLRVHADPAALGRMLANLLVNAVRYSEPGTSIEVSFEASEEVGTIRVTDHGRGIAAEDLPKIFDEFERGSMAAADGGTGLGLSSVRQLVTLQGGDVSIRSTPGQGTTVEIALPRA